MERRDLLLAAAAGAAMTAFPGTSAEALEQPAKAHLTLTTGPGWENDFSTRLHTWVIDQELDGKHDDIVLSREQYRHLRLHNQTYDISLGLPEVICPHFAGHRIRVPGTALA
jgi:hypothetical protein